MPELDNSLTRPKLDTTLIIDTRDEEGAEGSQCPLFALVSLNSKTAPTVEVPWSQLLALTLSQEDDPPVLTVGRHRDCNVLLQDPRVSLKHFDIVAKRSRREDDPTFETFTYACMLNDLSSNGTTVNGNSVGKGQSRQLRSGDEICVLASNKVGADKRIAFVFRNTTEMLNTPKEARQLDLDDHVVCPICMQVIYKCVALIPCFHNFCMACYSEWMVRKDDCPVCRQRITAIMKNHPMDAVIDAFLEASPERQRSPEDLREMDARDRLRLGAGGKIVRDICNVGASTDRSSSGAPQARGSPAAPPAGAIGVVAASSGANGAAAASATSGAAGSGTAAGGTASTTPASSRRTSATATIRAGTQVCTLQ